MKDLNYICGGNLLSRSVVVTAAHCVQQQFKTVSPDRLVIAMGMRTLHVTTDGVTYRLAHTIVVHPDLNIGLGNDIALVNFTERVEYSLDIQPICLWHVNDNLNVDNIAISGTKGTVVGWDRSRTRALSQTQVSVVARLDCIFKDKDFYVHYLTRTSFCAQHHHSAEICHGDSRGGMYFERGNAVGELTWQLRGLVSLAKGCDTEEFVIFTDIAQFNHWVLSYLNDNFSPDEGEKSLTSASDTDECGVIRVDFDPLVGEGTLQNGAFPWHARVRLSTTKLGGFLAKECAGTLVSKTVIVTAAKCVLVEFPEDHLVVLGYVQPYSTDNVTQRKRVAVITVHPDYNSNDERNGVALMRLTTEVTVNDFVRPICLWESDRGSLDIENVVGSVGYIVGVTIDLTNRSYGQKSLSPVSRTTCLRLLSGENIKYATDNHYCTVSVYPAVRQFGCAWTQGAGMYFPRNDAGKQTVYQLRGVVTTCIDHLDPVVLDVAQYQQWIIQNI